MDVGQVPTLLVAVPIVAGAAYIAVIRRLPPVVGDVFATIVTTGVLALNVWLLIDVRHGRIVTWLGGWKPHGDIPVGIDFVADPLSAGLGVLISALVLCAVLYGWHYFEDVQAHYYALIMLFLAGMQGFVMSGDVFDMFVFFELMGAAAYGLTGLRIEEPKSVQGALNFGIINSLGAYVTLMGTGLIYSHVGHLNLAVLGNDLDGHRPDAVVVVGFAFVVTGFLVKAAAAPFHFWLADAHAVAPTPICVLFSGVMVELGLYGVARVYWTSFSGTLNEGDVRRAFLALGVLTAVIGAVMCFSQRHLKRLLAYSTIAHMGIFLMAVAMLDTEGTSAAATYVLGHAGVKSALFLLTGIMLNRYGSVDEIDLHGRVERRTPVPWLFLLGGLALAGLPPFGTGLGKALSEEAVNRAGFGWGLPLIVIISAVTGGAVIRAALRIGWGLGPRDADSADSTSGSKEGAEESGSREATWLMSAVAVALLLGALAVGVVPGTANAVSRAAGLFTDHDGYVQSVLHAAAPVHVTGSGGWTPSGVLFDFVSVVLALAFAAVALAGDRLPAAFRLGSTATRPALTVVRRLHSGHIGDYVAYLLVGVLTLTLLLGVPLS